MVTLKALARVRVGIDARAIAVSDDGKHVIVGNYIPYSAVIVDTSTMQVAQYLDTTAAGTMAGKDSRVAGINATQRWIGYDGSAYKKAGIGGYFLMLLKDAGEVWRIDTTGTPGSFAIKKLDKVGQILHEAFNSEDQKTLFATAQASGYISVIDVASWTEKVKIFSSNQPHPGPGAVWTFDVNKNNAIDVNETFAATIHIGSAQLLVWNVDKAAAGTEDAFSVGTGGPGLFVNTSDKASGVWGDQTFSTTDTSSITKFSKDPAVLADANKRSDLAIVGASKLVHPEMDATREVRVGERLDRPQGLRARREPDHALRRGQELGDSLQDLPEHPGPDWDLQHATAATARWGTERLDACRAYQLASRRSRSTLRCLVPFALISP